MTVIDLNAFNALADEAARGRLKGCCSSPTWIAAVAADRPYPALDALLAGSDAAVAAMSESDLRAALDGHPRLGARQAAGSLSAREQSGVSSSDQDTRQQLATGNQAYEQRFGHIYLACATGRSAAELLAFLRERLSNDRETEWKVVAAELAKINRLRLCSMVGETK